MVSEGGGSILHPMLRKSWTAREREGEREGEREKGFAIGIGITTVHSGQSMDKVKIFSAKKMDKIRDAI